MTPRPFADAERERQVRRVLHKLERPGTRLVVGPGGVRLISLPRGGKGRALRFSRAALETVLRCGWIVRDPQNQAAFMLSDAGLGWLRREEAQHDPFASQHRIETVREIVGEDGSRRSVLVNEGESPLGWLVKRRGQSGQGLISEAQFQAGERLRRDFTLAQLTPRMAVDLTAPVVAGRRGAKNGAALPETVIAAKKRLRAALEAVGPGLADLLLGVCCHLVGLEDAERQMGWPQRTAKVVLQIAFERLAVHYGLTRGPRSGRSLRAGGGKLRAWRAVETKKKAREP